MDFFKGVITPNTSIKDFVEFNLNYTQEDVAKQLEFIAMNNHYNNDMLDLFSFLEEIQEEVDKNIVISSVRRRNLTDVIWKIATEFKNYKMEKIMYSYLARYFCASKYI